VIVWVGAEARSLPARAVIRHQISAAAGKLAEASVETLGALAGTGALGKGSAVLARLRGCIALTRVVCGGRARVAEIVEALVALTGAGQVTLRAGGAGLVNVGAGKVAGRSVVAHDEQTVVPGGASDVHRGAVGVSTTHLV